MWRCDKNFLPHTHTYHYTTAATRSNQFIYAFWPQAAPNAAAAAGAAEDDGGGGKEGGSPEGHCLFTTRSTSKNDKCQVRSHSQQKSYWISALFFSVKKISPLKTL